MTAKISKSIRKGLSFGLTSGVIATLGLLVGLNASTHSKMVVIGGILSIAIADSLSDALGIHISEETMGVRSQKEIWASTFSAFFAKLVFALTFLVPVLLLSLTAAVWVSIIWGLFMIILLSFFTARYQNVKTWKVVLEHLAITVVVILAADIVGILVGRYFQ